MDKTEIVFIDANIFLEVMLADTKADACKQLFEKLITAQLKALTSDFIIYACLLQIQHKLKSTKAMQMFILFINSLKGLKIIRPSLEEMHEATKTSERYHLDFDDSLVVSCMINNNTKTLISLDKDFDKVNSITREEP